MSTTTNAHYAQIINACKTIFVKKMQDYGTAWRIMRASSVTDQIYIKANRIRSIEQKGEMRIQEDIKGEYMAIVNYAIVGLIQLQYGDDNNEELSAEKGEALYTHYANVAMELMTNKNHDYGEAWRDMRVSSITDLILMKIFRTKQIEDNAGKVVVSEGIDANYLDMLNYAVFALIRLTETEHI
jgi:Nucleotide modification associated domain 1